jgi:hypothetical protein
MISGFDVYEYEVYEYEVYEYRISPFFCFMIFTRVQV